MQVQLWKNYFLLGENERKLWNFDFGLDIEQLYPIFSLTLCFSIVLYSWMQFHMTIISYFPCFLSISCSGGIWRIVLCFHELNIAHWQDMLSDTLTGLRDFMRSPLAIFLRWEVDTTLEVNDRLIADKIISSFHQSWPH